MRERIKAFLRDQDMCVLATTLEGKPHCSLMAYMTDEEGEWIYMVTHRGTTKYTNLLSNEQVSILVDNRCEGVSVDRSNLKALTVHGTFHAVEDPEARARIIAQVRERHPHMGDFLSNPEAEVISVRAGSFLFLDGIADSHYVTL